ncbi:hypothetical protein BpHYR1_017352 [Brachionus plicatilis]|uniref:Uncharacterized protein n=1 Tax=Brachionus plicatilis TaxID=10195 RepID=A0A3M7QUT1_BRAPC|nr:hypothetical protein BpHYR1_017352 [Brachionus plicatilis]
MMDTETDDDDENGKYFFGSATGVPSHNNALEFTNRYTKGNGLDRSRLAILQFLNLCRDDVKYELEPIFELKDWTNAFKWNLLRKKVVKINTQAFIRSSSGGTSLLKEEKAWSSTSYKRGANMTVMRSTRKYSTTTTNTAITNHT